MKNLLFYICTFAFILFTVNSKKLGNTHENYYTCLTENNIVEDDIFTEQEIIQDIHKQPENQEKAKKNGCMMQCMLQKSGVMEESEYEIEKMRSDFTRRTHAQPGSKKFEALDNCINQTKDLTEKCEKSLALLECFFKETKKITEPSENHEEHEHESEK